MLRFEMLIDKMKSDSKVTHTHTHAHTHTHTFHNTDTRKSQMTFSINMIRVVYCFQGFSDFCKLLLSVQSALNPLCCYLYDHLQENFTALHFFFLCTLNLDFPMIKVDYDLSLTFRACLVGCKWPGLQNPLAENLNPLFG